jgi:hypothetical protein
MGLSDDFAGKRAKVKCPKCKSNSFETHEVFENVVVISIKNGIFPDRADDHVAGGILGISCKCDSCGHRWTPRGAKTLRDIVA